MNTKTNSLKFNATKVVGKKSITVKIRLNDECKNGHQDFAITGDIYEAGKPKVDRYYISGGCIHDEILKYFPQFEPFVRLHLCDYAGIPMHPTANGLYHLQNGFNSKGTGAEFEREYCEYYRITPAQFKVLSTSRNEVQFYNQLVKLGILAQWKAEADKAIKQLEELTGYEFVNDSKRSQLIPPTPEEIALEEERQQNGYYTPEAENERAEAAKKVKFDKLEQEYNKEVAKHTLEFIVKKEVLTKGGSKALNNCIFYNHTQTLSFNWRDYDKMPVDVLKQLISTLVLPEGVTAEISKKSN